MRQGRETSGSWPTTTTTTTSATASASPTSIDIVKKKFPSKNFRKVPETKLCWTARSCEERRQTRVVSLMKSRVQTPFVWRANVTHLTGTIFITTFIRFVFNSYKLQSVDSVTLFVETYSIKLIGGSNPKKLFYSPLCKSNLKIRRNSLWIPTSRIWLQPEYSYSIFPL